MLSREALLRAAADAGYPVDSYEKVYTLVRILPSQLDRPLKQATIHIGPDEAGTEVAECSLDGAQLKPLRLIWSQTNRMPASTRSFDSLKRPWEEINANTTAAQ